MFTGKHIKTFLMPCIYLRCFNGYFMTQFNGQEPTTKSMSSLTYFFSSSFLRLETANGKVILHITDGGQRNIEDSIHKAVPVLGISTTSTLDHYLYQIEKFDCGLVSYIDFDTQEEIENKLKELINSKRWEFKFWKISLFLSVIPSRSSLMLCTLMSIVTAWPRETKISFRRERFLFHRENHVRLKWVTKPLDEESNLNLISVLLIADSNRTRKSCEAWFSISRLEILWIVLHGG